MRLYKTTSFTALMVVVLVPAFQLFGDDPSDHQPPQLAVDQEWVDVLSPQAIATQGFCVATPDIMDTRNNRLIDYRRMFKQGRTPTPAELQGLWRGANKGIVTLVGYKQFIKEIQPCGRVLIGDNIQVHQVSNDLLRCFGWGPKIQSDGQFERRGKFVVKPPATKRCLGHRMGSPFAHGAIISYRDGGNGRHDPVRLLVDRIVMLDDDHVLGRATANFGLLHIPLAYFVLERIR